MKKDIETIESKIVYQNKWMTLREDKILRANGHQGIYGVVEKNDFAVIAAVQDQQIYLVQQYRYPVENRFWELPQGSWEKSVISPIDLARAELKEETGIIADSMQCVGHLYLAYGFCNQGYDIFFATDLHFSNNQLDQEEADLITSPFPLSEFEEMITFGEIKDATTVAAFGLLRLKGFI
jgi:ADP-ribose pyrophosphatase